MKREYIYTGAALFLALLLSASFQNQKPVQKPADLPLREPGATFTIQTDKIFNASLSTTDETSVFTFQDFESPTFPPAGWAIESTGTNYWTRFLVSAYGIGTASAKFDFFSASTGTTQSLVTPLLPVSITGDSLKFDNAYATYQSEVDQLVIETSVNGGASYSTLVTLNGGVSGPLVTAPPTASPFVPTSAQWAAKRFALPAGVNKIRFKCISALGNNLYLDNIFIGSPYIRDVGTLSLNFPVNVTPAPIIPKATVKNFGTATQTFPVTMTISQSGYTSTQTVTSLAPGASQNVNFASWSPVLGNAVVTCYTQLTGDENQSNDTLQSNINVTSSYWLTKSSIPMGRYLGSGVGYSRNDTGWLYVLGGEVAAYSFQRFNLRTNTWADMALIPLGKDRQGSAILKDSIYCIGGVSFDPVYSADFYKYDINANNWVTRTSLPGPLGWCKGAGYQDSLIYVAGGYDGTNALSQVLLYNAKTNTWRNATSLPANRFGGGFAVKGDTLVYVSGVDGVNLVSSVYKGVISQTNRSVITWTTGASLPGSLSGGMFRFDAHTWDNRGIIITGGSLSIPFTSISNACLVYSPGADIWTTMPNKLTAWNSGQSGVAKSNGAYRLACAGGTVDGASALTVNEVFNDSSLVVGINNQSFTNTVANEYSLSQNYPNPFNPVTNLEFGIAKFEFVSLKVYDILGKEVAKLVNEKLNPGIYNYQFSTVKYSLSSGIYFYKIEAGEFRDVKKMMLIK